MFHFVFLIVLIIALMTVLIFVSFRDGEGERKARVSFTTVLGLMLVIVTHEGTTDFGWFGAPKTLDMSTYYKLAGTVPLPDGKTAVILLDQDKNMTPFQFGSESIMVTNGGVCKVSKSSNGEYVLLPFQPAQAFQ